MSEIYPRPGGPPSQASESTHLTQPSSLKNKSKPDQINREGDFSNTNQSMESSMGQIIFEDDVRELKTGRELTGIITGSNALGHYFLSTPVGRFEIKQAPPLAPNSQIKMRVQSVDHYIEAELRTINGQVQKPPLPLYLTLASDKDVAQPEKLKPLAASLNQIPLRSPAPPSEIQPGTKLVALVVPDMAGVAHPAIPSQGLENLRLTVGTSLTLEVVSIQFPSLSEAPKTYLSGVVIGNSPNGGLLLSTINGVLKLDTGVALMPGTEISFNILPNESFNAANNSKKLSLSLINQTTQPPDILAQFAVNWPSLREALVFLHYSDPKLAQQLLTNNIPSANARLTASILIFIAALRGGNLRGWLGSDAIQALERRGRQDLLARLSSDFQQMGRIIEIPVSGNWRALMFPFFDGQELIQMWGFYREQKREEQRNKQTAMRFVLELNLSNLGSLQLDGLINGRRFDLIVRSLAQLSSEVRQKIMAIFERSTLATGLSGTLIFSTDEIFPQSPLQSAKLKPFKSEIIA